MAHASKQLEKVVEKVVITKDQESNLRDKGRIVFDVISRKLESERDISSDFVIQGSLEIGTTLKDEDSKFDIDLGLYLLRETRFKETTETIHKWVKEAIEDHTNEVIDKNKCIRVVYSQGYHVDIPIYWLSPLEGISTLKNPNIPELAVKNDGWKQMDARAYVSWFNNKANVNPNLRNITILLKYLASKEKYKLPSGFILGIFCADNYQSGADLEESFCRTISRISDLHSGTPLFCYRPTIDQYENLFSSYDSIQQSRFVEFMKNLKEKSQEAYKELDKVESCRKWAKIFGHVYPNCDTLSNTVFLGSALSTGDLVTSKQGIVEKRTNNSGTPVKKTEYFGV